MADDPGVTLAADEDLGGATLAGHLDALRAAIQGVSHHVARMHGSPSRLGGAPVQDVLLEGRVLVVHLPHGTPDTRVSDLSGWIGAHLDGTGLKHVVIAADEVTASD